MYFQPIHYLLLLGSLGSIGGIVAALPDWSAATSPAFVGAVLINIGATVTAVLTRKPEKPWDGTDRRQ